MAQDKQQSPQSQNQNETFWSKNKNYVIAGVVVVLIVLSFVVKGQKPKEEQGVSNPPPPTVTTENKDGKTDAQSGEKPAESAGETKATPQVAGESVQGSGNVSAAGKLRVSDNPKLGNLMVESAKGKIYIATSRDFSTLVEKDVTVEANGSLDAFQFLGFAESKVAPADTTAKGGAGESMTGVVELSGKLQKSDNETLGNYTILYGTSVIYLKTRQDYSAWIDSDVHLTASGTLQSFTEAKIQKK